MLPGLDLLSDTAKTNDLDSFTISDVSVMTVAELRI